MKIDLEGNLIKKGDQESEISRNTRLSWAGTDGVNTVTAAEERRTDRREICRRDTKQLVIVCWV